MEGFNIGSYEIKWVDEDYLKIRYTPINATVKVCCGDFETILSALFITPEREEWEE